jgi:hypothetical protein
MKVLIVLEGQTIVDVAVQEYGCYEGVLNILEDNTFLALEDGFYAGLEIYIRDEVEAINEKNKQYQAQLVIKHGQVVTGIVGKQFGLYVFDGYWGDGYTDIEVGNKYMHGDYWPDGYTI